MKTKKQIGFEKRIKELVETVDILKEYKLILRKESKLKRSDRDLVKYLFTKFIINKAKLKKIKESKKNE